MLQFREIVFIIILVAVLASGAVTFAIKYDQARARGQAHACESNLKNIGTALEMYSTDTQGRFPYKLDRLTPNYLRQIPTCPTVGRNTYCYDLLV